MRPRFNRSQISSATSERSEPVAAPKFVQPTKLSRWQRLPLWAKILPVLAVTLPAGAILRPLYQSHASTVPAPALPAGNADEGMFTAIPLGTGAWQSSPVSQSGKSVARISIFSTSTGFSDYRFEMRADTDHGPLSFVYRFQDVRNYYAAKLETIRHGSAIEMVFTRSAMVNGVLQDEQVIPLPSELSNSTSVIVRLDAFREKFRTYVGEAMVDNWSNDRFKTGGVGLYATATGSAVVTGTLISALVPRVGTP